MWLGSFYPEQARYTEASQRYEQALSLTPDNARMYYILCGFWWSERPFAITRISPHAPVKAGKADTPFALPRTEPERAFNDGGIFVARSAVPDVRADDQE